MHIHSLSNFSNANAPDTRRHKRQTSIVPPIDETKSPITQGKNNKIVGNWHSPICIRARPPFSLFLCLALSSKRFTNPRLLLEGNETSQAFRGVRAKRTNCPRVDFLVRGISYRPVCRVIPENLISILSSVRETRYIDSSVSPCISQTRNFSPWERGLKFFAGDGCG